jgi:hypothetical protein
MASNISPSSVSSASSVVSSSNSISHHKVWCFLNSKNVWIAYSDEDQIKISQSGTLGTLVTASPTKHLQNIQYIVDTSKLIQCNLTSGQVRQISLSVPGEIHHTNTQDETKTNITINGGNAVFCCPILSDNQYGSKLPVHPVVLCGILKLIHVHQSNMWDSHIDVLHLTEEKDKTQIYCYLKIMLTPPSYPNGTIQQRYVYLPMHSMTTVGIPTMSSKLVDIPSFLPPEILEDEQKQSPILFSSSYIPVGNP